MNKTATATKVNGSSPSAVNVDSKLYTVGLTTIGLSAAVIGVWAFASIVGGIIASGGPLTLVGKWFSAVFGG